MRVSTKRLKPESRGFRYKVALYFSYLHIKFDDKTKGNPFEFQAYLPIRLCPKLNWRLGLALFVARFRNYLDLWHKSMATNERAINKSMRKTERWFADPLNVYLLSSALSTNVQRYSQIHAKIAFLGQPVGALGAI